MTGLILILVAVLAGAATVALGHLGRIANAIEAQNHAYGIYRDPNAETEEEELA